MGDEIMWDMLRGGTDANDGEGPHKNAIHNVPELHYRHCQRVQWTF